MNKLINLFFFSFFLCWTTASASPTGKFERLISHEIRMLKNSLDEGQFFIERTGEDGPQFNLTGFEMIVATPIGVRIPFLAGLEIVPEIEIIWERVSEE
jgi:hypothetical protein